MEIESKNFYTVIAKSNLAKGQFSHNHCLGQSEQIAIDMWLAFGTDGQTWDECKDEWQVIKVSLENGREL